MWGFIMQNIDNKLTPTQTNQSSDKLLKMMEILSEQTEPLRLQDVASLCDMNASTALRFLAALQRRNYVSQDQETKRYYLTFKICDLAQNITSSLDIRNLALPYMRSISGVFAESCHLTMESDMTVMYIDMVRPTDKIIMGTERIGRIAPMHCTGAGKLFLSQYSSMEFERFLAVKKLPRFTEHTIVDAQSLKAELEKIRELGYAFDNEECEQGARCVAVPVRNYNGIIKYSVSVSGPTSRMTDNHIFTNLPFLLETANQISSRMGWNGDETE